MTAIEETVSANSRDLLAYLQRRMDHPEDAADALGDLLVVVWRRRAAMPADPLEARLWLFGVAANTLQNHRRSHRRHSDAVARLRNEILTTKPTICHDADDAVEVRGAVEKLPSREREPIRLIHWEGFTVAEAARVSGINESTARSRYASARSRLRTILGSHDLSPAVISVET
jgi:RNA polymerase sigma-70 factor, ECF subfamily